MFRRALVAALVLLAVSAAAQKADRVDPATLLRVCSDKNPPPCATPPKVRFSPDPAYTPEARDLGIEGTVVLVVVIGTDGHTHQIRVARSLGHGLDEQAIAAVRRWKFKPATAQGKPVAVAIDIEINFHL